MGLSRNKLEELVAYNLVTGIWTRKVSRGRFKAGSRAGCINSATGYRVIKINGKQYRSSRLAHLYMTGEWPEKEMDHINRIKDDDRWENLRPATRTEQVINRGMQKNNTSGHKGVSWDKRKKKWKAQIKVDKKQIHLGLFDNLEEAVAVRKEAELKYFGEFASV